MCYLWAIDLHYGPLATWKNNAQKMQLSSKVDKFAGYFGNNLALIFFMHDFFCAILSFWDVIDFVFFLRDWAVIWRKKNFDNNLSC